MNPYESPKLLAEYLLLHYGGAEDVLDGMPGPADAVGFPTRLVRELLAPVSDDAIALDLGCAVGGSSFELARSCRRVIGIDFSQSFIDAANHLRETGEHPFRRSIEGDIDEPAVARVPADIVRTRVVFQRGDACDLDPGLGAFHVVLAANLLCRLPDPIRLIERLPSLVEPGGQLLLTTPFTWLEEFTPREKWIGGTAAGGRSFDALRALLEPHFTLESVCDLPFLIREHARKFQYGVACGSRWRRR
mgnify:CR=1 FL=1